MIEDVLGAIFKEAAKAGQWLIEKNKELDYTGAAARRYAAHLEERYNTVRVFGMDKPLPLREIFVRVNVLEKITARQRISIDDLRSQFESNRRSFGTAIKTMDGLAVANELAKFIVLGKPGSGKTTFLKFLALQSLDGRLKQKRLPIFVGIRDFADSGKTLFEFINSQFDLCHLPNAMPFVTRILNRGKCQILLDGLDEVNTERRDEVIKELYDFTEKYGNNQIVLSCRIAAYNHWFDKFTDVEIADFNETQMRNFVHNWFRGEPEVVEQCWQKLNENRRIQELGTNPLLLTLLCLSFNEAMDFPQNRAELYREAIHAFLKKWDSSRRIKRDEILYRGLTAMRKESLFARIAAAAFENDEYFFPQRKLELWLLDFIQHLPRVRREAPEPDGEALLKEIEAQHGIFVERASRIYSFAHLTFQEYFTARYLVANAVKGTIQRLVAHHLTDDRWREIFLLTAEMLDDASQLLLLIDQKCQAIGLNTTVTKYLEASNEVVKASSPYPQPINRALALFKILDHTLQILLVRESNQRSLLTQARELASELAVGIAYELIGTAAIHSTLNWDYAFENAKAHSFAVVFNYDAELVTTELIAYLKANVILIECLNTECCVSASVRQEIVDNLLSSSRSQHPKSRLRQPGLGHTLP